MFEKPSMGGESTDKGRNLGFDWRGKEIEKAKERFSLEHQQLYAKYATELPAPGKNLEVVTVVPAFRELGNDNFWNLLASANAQTKNAAPFEILYVVNNPEGSSENRPDAFLENQKTLQIMRLLRTLCAAGTDKKNVEELLRAHAQEVEELGLTDREAEVLREAVVCGTPFYGIDASSPGTSIPVELNPRGQARNIGAHLAYERLRMIGAEKEGIIDFIDADCALSTGYYAKLLKQSEDSLVCYKSLYAVTPDVSEYVEKETHPEKQLLGLIRYLKIALLAGRAHYQTNIDKTGANLERTGHGPSIALRAAVVKEVGGYPVRHGSEDFIFQELIDYAVPEEKQRHTTVRLNLSHRSREDSADGFEVGVVATPEDESMHNALEALRSPEIDETQASDALKREARAYVVSLLQKDSAYADNPQYRAIREREFKIEQRLRRKFLSSAKKVISSVCARLERGGSIPHGMSEYEMVVQDLDAAQRDYLLSHPSLLEAIMTASFIPEGEGDGALNEKVLAFFETYLPEYFGTPPEQEPRYDEIQRTLSEEPSRLDVNTRDLIHIARAVHLFERSAGTGEHHS